MIKKRDNKYVLTELEHKSFTHLIGLTSGFCYCFGGYAKFGLFLMMTKIQPLVHCITIN